MDEELELLVEEEEVTAVVVEELQDDEEDEVVAVHVDAVPEEAVEAGTSPSMSAALWECDRQRALIGSRPSCRETPRKNQKHKIIRLFAPFALGLIISTFLRGCLW